MADTQSPAAAAVAAVEQKSADAVPAVVTEKQPEAKDERFEALARKERQLLKMRKEIESERNQLKQRAVEYETGYVSKSRLTEDPFGTLSEAGLTYDKLTELLLATPNMNDPAIRALTTKIKALEDKNTAAAKQAEEAQAAQYTEAIKQITNEIKQLVSTGDGYEMIRETNMAEAVTELIEQTYNSEGYLMDTEEACKQVEEHLLIEAEKISKLKKLQDRLQPKAPEVTGAPTKQSPNQIKTLTNAVSAQPTKRLSEKDRIARAMAAFNGKLT
jgi:hypothetical protein